MFNKSVLLFLSVFSLVYFLTSCTSVGGPNVMIRPVTNEKVAKIKQSAMVLWAKDKENLNNYWETNYDYNDEGILIKYSEERKPIYSRDFRYGLQKAVWQWNVLGGHIVPKSYEYFIEKYGDNPSYYSYFDYKTLDGINTKGEIFTDIETNQKNITIKTAKFNSGLYVATMFITAFIPIFCWVPTSYNESLDISRYEVKDFAADNKFIKEKEIIPLYKYKKKTMIKNNVINTLTLGFDNVVLTKYSAKYGTKNKKDQIASAILDWEAINGKACLKKLTLVDGHKKGTINLNYDNNGRRIFEQWLYEDDSVKKETIIFEQVISYKD